MRFRQIVSEHKKKLKKITKKAIEEDKKNWDKFTETFVYNCNALEGSSLTREEVKKLLRKKK